MIIRKHLNVFIIWIKVKRAGSRVFFIALKKQFARFGNRETQLENSNSIY